VSALGEIGAVTLSTGNSDLCHTAKLLKKKGETERGGTVRIALLQGRFGSILVEQAVVLPSLPNIWRIRPE
jgi:hypothetical protein